MRKELDDQLCRKYPGLYRDRYADKQSAMHWGFECGDGWFTLIDVISGLLIKHDPDIFAMQVKEKSGSLRFYHSGGKDGYALGIEMTAEILSKMICEVCGAPALLNNDSSFWATRCAEHTSEYLLSDDLQIDTSSVANLDLGKAWSQIVVMLQESADFHSKQNGMPEATFQISKENGKLVIKFTGGDEMTSGMVDIVAGYANRIDEHAGLVVTE